jgi:hypothetical protein
MELMEMETQLLIKKIKSYEDYSSGSCVPLFLCTIW